MNKKMVKVLSTVMMIVIMISIACNCFAITPSNVVGKENVNGSTQILNVGNSMVGILRTVGIVLSVIILIVIGIKYMMCSAEEKADYKKTMIPYVVGAGVLFAASALAEVIYQFFTGISIS